jgi:hypothetical protein
VIGFRYMSKKSASERFGMLATYAGNTEAKGGRGAEEEHSSENLSKSTKAIEKIFQA